MSTLHLGDCLEVMAGMEAASVQCCVTSPPYWGLRDYGCDGQLGLEATPDEYVAKMVAVFREVRRVLRDDGTLWLNLGDSYASPPAKGGSGPGGKNGYGEGYARALRRGSGRADGIVTEESPRNRDGAPPCGLAAKQLVGIPWRVAFALQSDGWYLRSDIIWNKPNPMPESVRDRPTKAHEYLFLLSKSARYYYDADAIAEPLSSGPSDLKKMAQGLDRIGGLTKESTDPRARASSLTNMGRKRSVGSKHAAATALGLRTQASLDAAESASRDESYAGRNRRSVWTVATQPFPGAHFAVMPEALVEPCVLAGCPSGGTVLDAFAGSGTVGVVACRYGRDFIGCELNPEYVEIARRRIEAAEAQLTLAGL